MQSDNTYELLHFNSDTIEHYLSGLLDTKPKLGHVYLLNGFLYTVYHIDAITGVAKSVRVETTTDTNIVLYFDDSQETTVVNPDPAFTYSGQCSYAIIENHNGDIISEIWDGDTFVTNRVNLNKINSDSHEEIALYVIGKWSTHEHLMVGELVTIKIYDVDEHLLYDRQGVLVSASGYSDATPCHDILSVDLQSPFMKNGEDVIRPINIEVKDLNFTVLVTKSNGTETLPLSNPRVNVVGLDIAKLNITQIPIDIALVYNATDQPVNTDVDSSNHITKLYKLINIPANDFSPNPIKLIPYLTYAGQDEGWRLRASLLTGDGSLLLEVTELINITGYDSLLIGIPQEVTLSLDLGLVNGIKGDYAITYKCDIKLNNFGGQTEPAFIGNYINQYIKPFEVINSNNISTVTITDSESYFLYEYIPESNIIDKSRINKFKVYSTIGGDQILPISMLESPIKFQQLNPNDIIVIELLESYNDIEIVIYKVILYV